MFAVPGDIEPLTGGQGGSVRAGDLVLSPGRGPRVQDLLSPVLARLAVDLDTRPGRDHRDLRIAMPVPARDGSWVVDGWAASRFEPGTRQLTDLAATRAVGAVLHAELARVVSSWPPAQEPPVGRWAEAERVAFGERPLPADALGAEPVDLLARLAAARDDTDLGPAQLVNGDLAGNILLDPRGAPVVVDLAPYWRPALWAEATAVLDCVVGGHADPLVIREWSAGPHGQAMLRAAIFRVVSDRPVDLPAYEAALAPLLARIRP